MRLSPDEHRKHDWRVHQEAGEYRLLDIWQYPIEAGSESDFERFLEVHDLRGMAAETSVVVKSLFALRGLAGRCFGWDRNSIAFQQVYRTSREQLLRTENATVKALLHLGWVQLENGCWTAQLAVYVIPKGCLGSCYMACISPFRHFIVYPSLMRTLRRRWIRLHA